MSRPLSPFVRHLGQAKHRARQIRLAVERVEQTAILAAGLSGSHEDLARAITNTREQLAMLEKLAAEWRAENT